MRLEFVNNGDPKFDIQSPANPTDSGVDIWITSVFKKLSDVTTMYETDIAVKPPPGYYLELVPRSSIVKSGYMLTNGIGIIDNGYRGTIKVVLSKIDSNAPPIVLPCKLAQLIARPILDIQPVKVLDLNDNTERGTGGFGSTSAQQPECDCEQGVSYDFVRTRIMTNKITEMRNILEDNHGVLDQLSVDEWSPIHVCAADGTPEMLRLLVEFGADVNARTRGFNTPLMLAARANNIDCLEELCKLGADTTATNTSGCDVIDFLAEHDEILRMDLERGGATLRYDEGRLTIACNSNRVVKK